MDATLGTTMMSAAKSPSKARLIVGAGEGEKGRVLSIEPLPFTIGRSAERHLFLPDPRVSRDHAFIDRDGEGYFLRDMGSRHGTYVNGMRLEGAQCRLHSQDRIVLGMSSDTIVFEELEDESTTRTLLARLSEAGAASNDLETLSLFLQAAQSLNSQGALRDVLKTMVEYTVRLTQAERGFVFLGSSPETFKLAYGQDDQGVELTEHPAVSASIIRDAALSELDFVLGDAAAEAASTGRETLVLHAIRSVAAIPLRGLNSGRLLGMLYLDSRRAAQDFTRINTEILHVIALQAAMLVENLAMLEAEREAALLRKELEIAATIQQQIIPQKLPQFAGVRLEARTVPCTGVGGDFYDVIPLPDGFVALVADVCGKGVPAALLASMVQGMMHSLITSGASLVDALTQVNRFVCMRAPVEKYLTVVVMRYRGGDDGGGEIELVNGGHVAPIILRADGSTETLSDGDMPVGLIGVATYHALTCALHKGDRLVLLSDGVSEAEDAAGEQFGTEAVVAAIVEEHPVAALFAALGRFCVGCSPQDDQTVLTLEVVA